MMSTDQIDFDVLKNRLRTFCEKRNWMFAYSVKNLTMAASVEMGELMEVIQWLSEEEMQNLTADRKSQMADEIADTMNNLVMLSDVLQLNISEAIDQKIAKNAIKYPIES